MKKNTQTIEGTREQIRTAARKQVDAAVARLSVDTTAADIAEAKLRQTIERMAVNLAERAANRSLATPQVMDRLQTLLPQVAPLAVTVGTWIWVTFPTQPEAAVRAQLSQLGFHWNRERQCWQHPCGKFSLGSKADPREKYPTQPATLAA